MTDTTSPPNLELILEAEHWLIHDAAYTNKRASDLIRRLCTGLGHVETDRNRLRTSVAELEQQLAESRDRHQHEWDRPTSALASVDHLGEKVDEALTLLRQLTAPPIAHNAPISDIAPAGVAHNSNAPAGCPTCTGPLRETAGMVCQTCGTDYAPAAEPSPLVGAMHSVWLHGSWGWLTRQMTTPQKEAAADAVDAYSRWLDEADGEASPPVDRWWRADAPAAAATTGGEAS